MEIGIEIYQPPSSDLKAPRRDVGRLYSPGQVSVAAFPGSPIAGCWLLGSNYRVVGIGLLSAVLIVILLAAFFICVPVSLFQS